MSDEQRTRIRDAEGFIAALDQSGGSTPKALRLYGIEPDAWATDEEMFDLVHQMRTRIIRSVAFDGRRVLGAILFEGTMDREVDGRGTAEYLWSVKGVVPFLKVDKGLTDERDGVQLMKPMPDLDSLVDRARSLGVFGTKMRSVVLRADPTGIAAVVAQQFAEAARIIDGGLVPIIEPEVDIHSADKEECERLLKASLVEYLGRQSSPVMLKLTLPTVDDFYRDLVEHPAVLRVVALSGGYSREEANARLARNHGMIASFSRALTEGVSAQQSDAEFDATLDAAIESIFQASRT